MTREGGSAGPPLREAPTGRQITGRHPLAATITVAGTTTGAGAAPRSAAGTARATAAPKGGWTRAAAESALL